MWTVYEHISPSGKVYVGITSQIPYKRWKYGTGYRENTIFSKAISKYGWDNIKHIIIATNLGERTAKNIEIDLIKFYKEQNKSYNITMGGDGTTGRFLSYGTRVKISKAHTGKQLSEEHKYKCTKALIGRSWSEEQRVKFKSSFLKKKESGYIFKGHPCSDKNKEILRQYKLGIPRSTEVIKKLQNNNSCLPVLQYSITNEFIREFKSINEAVRETSVNKKGISRCCRGIQQHSGNYIWRFKNECK